MGAAGRAALIEGWPVLVTTLVVALSFGIVSRQHGIDPIVASGMSFIVFAGASQFAMLELLSRNTSAPLIVLTVLLINLRHLLMAAALRPRVAGRSLLVRLGLAYVLTDEAFAFGIGWFRRGHSDVRYYVVFGVSLWLCWNVGTIAGAVAGAGISDPRRLGLDFAITATFVAIVVLGVRRRGDVAVALVAGAIAGVLRLAGAASFAVVLAGAIAPLVAFAGFHRSAEGSEEE
jgi:4-azaleucine resistance transporter AzlC